MKKLFAVASGAILVYALALALRGLWLMTIDLKNYLRNRIDQIQ